MSGKRIYELTEKSNLENDYFMALDKSGTANAQKVNVSKILNPINNISGSADEYSSTKAYAVGDLVIHDNKLYKCTTACSAAAWSTNQGYFTQSTLTTELTNVKSSLNSINVVSLLRVSSNIAVLTDASPNAGLKFTVPKGKWILIGQIGWNQDAGNQFVHIGATDVAIATGEGACGVSYWDSNADTDFYIASQTAAFTANNIWVVGIKVA